MTPFRSCSVVSVVEGYIPPLPATCLSQAGMKNRYVEARAESAVDQRAMAARINVDHLPNVLRLCPPAAEPAHQWRNRFLVAMTDERNVFGGVENLQFLALGLFVAYCVRMEDVGVGQIDQIGRATG